MAEVTWITWFGAYYQESKNFVFALPVDTDTLFQSAQGRVHRQRREQMDAFRNTRTGALVERRR